MKLRVTKVPAVQPRGLSRSNRSDSNFGLSVWAESSDSAAHSKH